MKIKLFAGSPKIEDEINKFLESGIHVKDIKFSSTEETFDVMIIYEDMENTRKDAWGKNLREVY